MRLILAPMVLIAAMPFAAHAVGPIDGKLYGKINLTFDKVDFEDETTPADDFDEWQLNSNNSRIGVSGKTALNGSLSVIYKLEWQVATDGDGTDLTARNRYLGLTGGFGTILAGKHDTPTKLAQHKIDLFNDLVGDIGSTFEGENRESNIVMYSSPELGAFSITGAFIPGEDSENGDDGIADGISIAVQAELDNLYVALAIDDDVDGQDLIRLVGQFELGDLTLGAMAQVNDGTIIVDTVPTNIDEQGLFFSASYKIGNGLIKSQIGKIENDEEVLPTSIEEETTFSIGYDHKLGTSTTAFTYVTLNTDTTFAGDDIETTVFGVGLDHSF